MHSSHHFLLLSSLYTHILSSLLSFGAQIVADKLILVKPQHSSKGICNEAVKLPGLHELILPNCNAELFTRHYQLKICAQQEDRR